MTEFIDPKTILFSLPTLCENTPAVDRLAAKTGCRTLHEDDWRQIEFVTLSNGAHIDRELALLAAFKQQHRRGPGWTNVYLRKEHPFPFPSAELRFANLPAWPLLGLTFASGSVWGGSVKGGFALTDVSNWFIYGQQNEKGQIIQLALSQSSSAISETLSRFVWQVAAEFKLLLVDWYACSVVDVSTPESAREWSMRYKPAQT